MEVAGLAFGVLGVIGLFSVCVDVLEKFDIYRDFDATSKQLATRFNVQKTRLQEWGKAVGLRDGAVVEDYNSRLDDGDIRSKVEMILFLIHDLFVKTEHISDKTVLSSSNRKNNNQASEDSSMGLDLRLEFKLSTRTKFKGMFGSESRLQRHIDNLERLLDSLDILVPRQVAVSSANFLDVAEMESHYQEITRAILSVNSILMDMLMDNQKRKEIEDFSLIADILNVPKISDPLSTQLSTRLDGTCDWIFQRTPYKEWLTPELATSSFLWLHGPAGFGKTILCSRIVQVLRESFQVYHFFAPWHVQAGGEPEGIISIWLFGIASVDQRTREVVLGSLNLQGHARNLSSTDLWKAFKTTVANLQGAIFVLDGLDEYQQNKQRKVFLKNLKDSMAQTQCRVLMTSRDQPDIRSELTHFGPKDTTPILHSYGITPKDTLSDIQLYSNKMVKQKLEYKQATFKQELAQDLMKRSEGMFLWVALCCRALHGSMSRSQLKRAVNMAPDDLYSTYERDWRAIINQDDGYSQQRGLRILQWSMFAFRPLTVGELTVALGVQECDEQLDLQEIQELQKSTNNHYADENILVFCHSLVDVRSVVTDNPPSHSAASSIVQLKHTSVKEFLTLKMPRCTEGVFNFDGVSDPSHHLELAKVCLRFLCHDKLGSIDLDTDEDELSDESAKEPLDTLTSFRNYALGNWLDHSRKASAGDADYQTLLGIFLQSDSRSFRQWASQFDYPEGDGKEDDEDEAIFTAASPLYFATLLGDVNVFHSILKNHTAYLNKAGGRNGTPLQAACVEGRVDLMTALLAVGANISTRVGRYGTALCTAAGSSQPAAIRCLLSHGAAIDDRGAKGMSPLSYATVAKENNIDVVRCLLKEGANVNNADDTGATPIFFALRRGHPDVAELFLEQAIDLSIKTFVGETVINCASTHGQTKIVQQLIDRGMDFDLGDGLGWTPLINASSAGHYQVVQLLLDAGAKIDKASITGWIPLNFAAYQGHLKIVEKLISAGTDINHPDNEGWTSLNIAAYQGHLKIVKMLISAGAEVNKASSNGWTALKSAASQGHLEILERLISVGADFNRFDDGEGWTSLNSAAYKGHLKIVERLIHAGADFNQPDSFGRTPLMAAVYEAQSKVVALLLRVPNVNINAVNKHGVTALMIAARAGDVKITRLLWEALAEDTATSDVSEVEVVKAKKEWAKDFESRSAIQSDPLVKINNGQAPLLSLLQPKHATKQDHLAHRDFDGRSVLHYAAVSGNSAILDLFINNVSDATDRDEHGKSVLEYACLGGHISMIEKLSSTFPTAFEATNAFTGWSPLHWACRSGTVDLLEMLYDAGHKFSVFKTSSPAFSWSPFDVASYCANRKIMDSKRILCEHPLWRKMDDSSLIKIDPISSSAKFIPQNSRVASTKASCYYCDGCLQIIVGVRYRCQTCDDLDYCFMCIESARRLHQAHGWKVMNLAPEDYDDPNAEKPTSTPPLVQQNIRTEDLSFKESLEAPRRHEQALVDLSYNERPTQPENSEYLSAIEMIREVLDWSWPQNQQTCTISCIVDWQLLDYLLLEQITFDKLEATFTISGKPDCCSVATLGAYISSIWGRQLFDALQDCFRDFRHQGDYSADGFPTLQSQAGNIVSRQIDGCLVKLFCRDDANAFTKPIFVMLDGTLDSISRLLQQFAWLTATLREHRGTQLAISEARFEAVSTQAGIDAASPQTTNKQSVVPFRLTFRDQATATQTNAKSSGQCWTKLFPRSILTFGFPLSSPDRPENALGLEIPFNIMAAFAGGVYPVVYDGQFAFANQSVLLTSQMLAGNSLQWHVESIQDILSHIGGSTDGTTPTDAALKATDISSCITSRAFFGHCDIAENLLGTEEFLELESPDSRVPVRGGGVSIKREFTFGIGLGAHGYATTQAAATIRFAARELALIQGDKTHIQSRLQRAKNESIVLYDQDSGTAFLVSKLSVVLQMAITYLRLNTFLETNKYPFASLQADGGQAAYQAIIDAQNLEICPHIGATRKLHDIVAVYLEILEQREMQRLLQQNDWRTIRLNNGLRGWDYADIQAERYHFYGRELKVDRPSPIWWELCQAHDSLVLFSRMGKQVIRASLTAYTAPRCQAWDDYPVHEHLLVAPIVQLLALKEQNCTASKSSQLRYLLSDKIFWASPRHARIFDSTTCQAGKSCNPVQTMLKIGKHNDEQYDAVSNADLAMQGAVLFAPNPSKIQSRPCKFVLPPSLPPIVEHGPLLLLPQAALQSI